MAVSYKERREEQVGTASPTAANTSFSAPGPIGRQRAGGEGGLMRRGRRG